MIPASQAQSPAQDPDVACFSERLAALAAGVRKTRSGERSRLRLLAAAARLLDQVHHRDLLVEQICQEAGVAKGTFYIYFKSKDEFLLDLASRYVAFEIQAHPRLSSKNSDFTNMRLWVTWYERTFAANVGIMKCLVQMGAQDPAMRDLWHQRNARLVDRSLAGWMKARPDSDPALERMVIRTAGTMMDQSLFERYGVQTGQGVELPEDPARIIDLHALLMFRALYARDPDPDDLPADSPFRRLLRPG